MKITLDRFTNYHRLFSYPDDDRQFQEHCRHQLRQLGVDYLLATGEAQLSRLPLLGCGYCGLVFAGFWHGREVAIKLRRRSCRQPDLEQEAFLQQCANRLGIGPLLYCHQGDIIIMERLQGRTFGDWLASLTQYDAERLRQLLLRVLRQSFDLDQAGIDHGALRCISEHVIVTDSQPTLIDFSHSSAERRPNNVTSLVSGLLWGTQLAQTIAALISLPARETMLPLLRGYKQQPNEEKFWALINAIGLDGCESEPFCC